jgi:hypothetical protein
VHLTVSGSRSSGPLVLDTDSWQQELLPELSPDDRALLSELDRQIIFDALTEFTEQKQPEGVEVWTAANEGAMGADAPLLVPGTRIYIRAGATAREAIKRLVRMAAVFAVTGAANPAVGFVGLTVDVVLDIFDRTSHLNNTDYEIIHSLIELRKASGEKLPTSADLRRALPTARDIPRRLKSLAERRIVVGDSSGWRVVF